MAQITINLDTFGTDSMKKLAYALASAGPEMRDREDMHTTYEQLQAAILELENRRRDCSELREMATHFLGVLTKREQARC